MGQQLSACTGADREEYVREYERRQEAERAFEQLNRPVVVAKDGGAAIQPQQPHARTIQQQARMGSAVAGAGGRIPQRRLSRSGETLDQEDDIDQLYDVAVSHVITHLQTQGAHAGPGAGAAAAAGSFARKSDLSGEYIGAVGSLHGLGPAPQPSWHRLTSIAHPPDDTLAIARANMPQLPPSVDPSAHASRRSSNAAAAVVAERSWSEAEAAAAPITPYDPLAAAADLAAAANASHALRWKPRFGSAVSSLAKTTPVADGTHAPTESPEERAARKAAKRARRMEREEALRLSLAAQKTQLLGGGKAASPSNAAPIAARPAFSQPQQSASSPFDQLCHSGRNPSVVTGSSPTAAAASAPAAYSPAQEAKESMEPAHQKSSHGHAPQQSFDRAPSSQQQQPQSQHPPPALKLHARKHSYFQESEDEEEDRFGGNPMVLSRHSTPKVHAAPESSSLSSQPSHAQPLRI